MDDQKKSKKIPITEYVVSLEKRVRELENQVQEFPVQKIEQDNKMTLIVFSQDMDKIMTAFILATGGVSMGLEVNLFFTFWGLNALKKKTIYRKKNILEKMATFMMPVGLKGLKTSNMNMMGMGPIFFKMLMKQKNVQSLPELFELSQELEVKITACQMTMGIMGIKEEEMVDGINYAGVANYLDMASESKITLYI